MNEQKINLTALPSQWSKLVMLVMEGHEVVLTNAEKPVARISPLSEKKDITAKNIVEENSVKTPTTRRYLTSEAWLG